MNNSTLNIQYTIAITALSLYDYKDVSPETMEILPTLQQNAISFVFDDK